MRRSISMGSLAVSTQVFHTACFIITIITRIISTFILACFVWFMRIPGKETKAHIYHRNAWEPHVWIAWGRRVWLLEFMSNTFVPSTRGLQFKLVVTLVTSKYQVSVTLFFRFWYQESLLPAKFSELRFFTCIALLWLHSPSLTRDIESQTSKKYHNQYQSCHGQHISYLKKGHYHSKNNLRR